jgi:SARP family transcriptional regulator, regulator of embCAB operon
VGNAAVLLRGGDELIVGAASAPAAVTYDLLEHGYPGYAVMVASRLRAYVTGEVCIERGELLLRERGLPGPLARHLLALLIAEHDRAIGHDEIAEELWSGSPPKAWRESLKALASRTRAALSAAGFDGSLIIGAPGVYRFALPKNGWIDLDAARAHVHAAETLLAAGEPLDAARQAFVSRLISARPLLPGRTGPWLERSRRELLAVRIRALECSARAHIARELPVRAIRDAEMVIELAPLREPGWRLLMDAHAAADDVASALDAYARCRTALSDALGVGPSTATRAQHEALLARTG